MGQFISHTSCPACNSSDALAIYDDGSGYCWSCRTYQKPTGEPRPVTSRRPMQLLPIPEAESLPKRNLSHETTKRWRYGYGSMRHPNTGIESRCQVATYFDTAGSPVAQKVRFADKAFLFLGGGNAPLYGEWLWKDGGKRIIVTEGEIDAMSVDQVNGYKWPVVSLPTGAAGAKKSLAGRIEWLNRFEEIVLMFDMDEPGRAAAEECAAMFPAGKVFIGVLPLKDANEMLQAGRPDELRKACWDAKSYRPDGIFRVSDLKDSLMETPGFGIPWPWPTLTRATYGRRAGEVYAFGAGTGVGKTDLLTQMIAHSITELDLPVATFFLEQHPTETVRRVAGKIAEKRFHIPDAGWKPEEYRDAIDGLIRKDKLYLYDSFGATEWDAIQSRIRFLTHNYGVKDVYLDHLTALAAAADDERTELERITCEMASLAKELQLRFHFVSHLCTPEGKPHEEGGRVMIRHFKGSRAIGFWSHFMFGMERNQQAEDPIERTQTTFRVLKDRYTGNSTGSTITLKYNNVTGILTEADADPFDDTPGDTTNNGAF